LSSVVEAVEVLDDLCDLGGALGQGDGAAGVGVGPLPVLPVGLQDGAGHGQLVLGALEGLGGVALGADGAGPAQGGLGGLVGALLEGRQLQAQVGVDEGRAAVLGVLHPAPLHQPGQVVQALVGVGQVDGEQGGGAGLAGPFAGRQDVPQGVLGGVGVGAGAGQAGQALLDVLLGGAGAALLGLGEGGVAQARRFSVAVRGQVGHPGGLGGGQLGLELPQPGMTLQGLLPGEVAAGGTAPGQQPHDHDAPGQGTEPPGERPDHVLHVPISLLAAVPPTIILSPAGARHQTRPLETATSFR
jgi:hypothetical protein